MGAGRHGAEVVLDEKDLDARALRIANHHLHQAGAGHAEHAGVLGGP